MDHNPESLRAEHRSHLSFTQHPLFPPEPVFSGPALDGGSSIARHILPRPSSRQAPTVVTHEHATSPLSSELRSPQPFRPSRYSRRGSRSSSTSSATLVSRSPTPATEEDRGSRFMAAAFRPGQQANPLLPGAQSSSFAYAHYTRGPKNSRPLINYITNDWRNETKSRDEYEFPSVWTASSDLGLPRWMAVIRPRPIPKRVQRWIGVWLTLITAIWLGYVWILKPIWAEQLALERALLGNSKKGVFGSNMRPAFTDMKLIQTLDGGLLPTPDNGRRLIFVGDVHGCKDELVALLDKVAFRDQRDHLVFVGDIIAKGPDSRGVVDLARDMGASSVRGNHEDRVLLADKALRVQENAPPGPDENPALTDDAIQEESFSHGDYKERQLAKELGDQQKAWLEDCPVILRIGHINGMGEVVVTHAGLVAAVPLERQDPFQAMNMRTVDLETRMPSETRDGTPWEKLWNHYQSRELDPEKRATVIYGHDSKRGFNNQPFSKGLDSGCVDGGQLTALVVGGDGKQTYEQVPCKSHRK